MKITRRIASIAAAAVIAAAGLAGCTSATASHSDASRVRFYSSVQELAADSTAIVSGTVTAQNTATDIDPTTVFTISTVTVKDAPKGSGLTPGSTVEVRQFGDSNQVGPAPLLTQGTDYLLYLTASGLSGPLASQYYVTGGTAGVYEASTSPQAHSSETTFSQVQPDAGDTLPATVNISQAQG